MRIAVDFDGTIFDKQHGCIFLGVQPTINNWVNKGHEVTVFTNRPDYEYSTVLSILRDNNIFFNRLICGKPSYDLFIDDKAKKFEGWDHDYSV